MEQTEKPKAQADKVGLSEKIKLCLSEKTLPAPTDRRKFDHDFAISTSFHGVHNIVRNRSRIRKVIWLLVVLGSVGLLVWQIYSRLVNYFRWPTTTSMEVQYVEKIEFPAVTFCNLNRFQAEAAATFGIIFFLWNIVSKVLHLQEINTNSTGSKEAIDFLASEQNFSITQFVKKNGFYLDSSTLLECDIFGKPCGPEDFAHVFTEYGNCFTFNHDENTQAKEKVSVSGRGLSLLFNVNQEEFTDDPTLGFIDAGIIFIIHSPMKVPQFDGLGLSAPVGMHARVTISQVKTVHQEHPWGECNPHMRLQNFRTYSTSGCLQECKAWHIEKQCGCLPFLLPGNGIECDLQQFYHCVSPVLDYIEVEGLCTMGTHNSSCPVPCEETEYPATISYSTFPSQRALKHLSKKLNQSQQYIRENLVNIEINYSDLNYKITQQQKAVSVSELLADVGGQLGLFCGASVITIIEIIEYIFTNFYWICILFLLKIPEMTQGAPETQNHLENKNSIQEC
ncbi:acid-sensing ion channel 5 [Hippopotamus amphibius kiboko]|uniref:acid-sensing ion channel 5 n=1 Tax=Hippopotamus amphibius kiboko TaxID=575201 RepID=UPI0025946B87|nr:acid-sensing ion channel 5 [Hippopotamus amphibius kiboko]